MIIEGCFENLGSHKPWRLELFSIDQPLPDDVIESLKQHDLNMIYQDWRKGKSMLRLDQAPVIHLLATFQNMYDETVAKAKVHGVVRKYEGDGRHGLCPLSFKINNNVLEVDAKFEFKLS